VLRPTQLAVLLGVVAHAAAPAAASDEPLLPHEWGAPPVAVSRSGVWTVSGRRHQVTLDARTLAITVRTAAASWAMPPSSTPEMLVVRDGDEFGVRLTDASDVRIEPYETGFSSGVKVVLDGFRSTGIRDPGASLGIRLYLTVALEGGDEDVCFEVSADEREGATIRLLDWPPPWTDARWTRPCSATTTACCCPGTGRSPTTRSTAPGTTPASSRAT